MTDDRSENLKVLVLKFAYQCSKRARVQPSKKHRMPACSTRLKKFSLQKMAIYQEIKFEITTKKSNIYKQIM